jgi:hypothetical protein
MWTGSSPEFSLESTDSKVNTSSLMAAAKIYGSKLRLSGLN